MQCPYCGSKSFIEDRTVEESIRCHWNEKDQFVDYESTTAFDCTSVDNIRCNECKEDLGVDFFTENRLQAASVRSKNNSSTDDTTETLALPGKEGKDQ